MEVTKEEVYMFIQYLWEEEIERRCEENCVLKELYGRTRRVAHESE